MHVSCVNFPAPTDEFTLCLEDEDVSMITYTQEGGWAPGTRACTCRGTRRSVEARPTSKKHAESMLCPLHRSSMLLAGGAANPLEQSSAQSQLPLQHNHCSEQSSRSRHRKRTLPSCRSSGNIHN